MLKADLRKPEIWAVVGKAVERVWEDSGLSLKEFADRISREERQVARWFKGDERPQVDAVFAVKDFRGPMVVALAAIAGECVEMETTIRIRRMA